MGLKHFEYQGNVKEMTNLPIGQLFKQAGNGINRRHAQGSKIGM